MAVKKHRGGKLRISGVKWHDVACHMRSKIVCEDSEALLQRARRENPGQVIPEPVAKKT